MPAPKRVSGRAVLTTVYLPDEVLQALRVIASARTAKERRRVTVSEVIREAVEQYVRDQVTALGLQLALEQQQVDPAPTGTDPAPDPIILFRRKQFEKQLDAFERSFQRLVDEWERLKPRIAGGYGTRVLSSEFFRLRDQVRDHEKWLHRILRDYKIDIRDQVLDSRVRDLVTRVVTVSGELQKALG